VTPLQVLQQVTRIINGGLDRAGVAYRLARVTADRWWSGADVLAYCQEQDLGLLCWAKAVKTVLEALAALDEADPNWKPVTQEVVDPNSGQVTEAVVGYQLETELAIYDLPQAVRAIVDWDGTPGGRKVARLAAQVDQSTLGTAVGCDELRSRSGQRVEILLKPVLSLSKGSCSGGCSWRTLAAVRRWRAPSNSSAPAQRRSSN